MFKNALIRVYNDKYDMTYCTTIYKDEDKDVIEEFGKNSCKRYAVDYLGADINELDDLKTEFLFDYRNDAILNNNYFK